MVNVVGIIDKARWVMCLLSLVWGCLAGLNHQLKKHKLENAKKIPILRRGRKSTPAPGRARKEFSKKRPISPLMTSSSVSVFLSIEKNDLVVNSLCFLTSRFARGDW